MNGKTVIDILPQSQTAAAAPPRRSDGSIFQAAKGGGIIFAGDLFLYGSRLIIGILLARFLGAEQFGLYNLAMIAGTTAAGLAFLGLEPALVRYISLFAGRRDTARLWGTLQVGLGLPTIVSVLTGVGLYALATPIAEDLFHEPRLVPLLYLAALMVPLLTLTNALAAATRGFNKMQYTVIAQKAAQPLSRMMFIIVLALFGFKAAEAVTSFILSLVVTCLILFFFLNRLFPLRRALNTAQRDIREIVVFALPVYFSQLMRNFRGNIQSLLLGTLNTITSVGIFAAAAQVNLVGNMFHQAITTASMPIVSELDDSGDREQMARFYQTMSKWTFTLNLPLFLMVLLFPTPILTIFGESFVEGSAALSILAWRNLVIAGAGICGVIIDMSGYTKLKFINSTATLALTLGLDFLLIPRWGLTGAAVAALATVVAVNLLRLTEVYILFRMLPFEPGFLKPVAAGLVALAAAGTVRQLFQTQVNLFTTALNIALLMAVYTGMILLLGLSKEDRAIVARIGRRLSDALPR